MSFVLRIPDLYQNSDTFERFGRVARTPRLEHPAWTPASPGSLSEILASSTLA